MSSQLGTGGPPRPPEEGGRPPSKQTGGKLFGVDGGGVHRMEEAGSETENRGEDEEQQGMEPRHRGVGGGVPKIDFWASGFLFPLSLTPPTLER